MKTKKTKTEFVASVVLWADACIVGDGRWTEIEADSYPVLTVGIIAEENDETLHLARDNDGMEDRPWRAIMAIPKVLIIERRDFKIAPKFNPVTRRAAE